jgi:transcriptional regulator with PAS, ATPase and Fis domain
MQRNLVGWDMGLKQVCELSRRAARTDATVLVQGETGTGKELVARFIHDHSARAERPFVAVNCAALPEGLLESELFGHEQGAFTGALRARKGRFELAQGGTLFLDEIGDVSPRLQVALLRVLQERKVERLGSGAAIALDVRIIAATHRNLAELVAARSFRDDLYYRLNVIALFVPPLRERARDIDLLLHHFLEKWAHTSARLALPRVAPGVIAMLAAQRWPGNVRELENLVQRALALSDGESLEVADFCLPADQPFQQPNARRELERRETERLRGVLSTHDGNCARAARALGIPRTTLVSRAKRVGLI